MPSAQLLRQQIETALSDRIPSALTPAPCVIRPTASTGIPALDDALSGGLPIGAITELAGPECSGRTSLALSFVACLTNVGRVCAWVDVSDTLHPESAAAIGVDLNRLLWIRCGPAPQQLTLPGMSHKQSDKKLSSRSDLRSPVPGTRRPVSAPPIRHDYLAPRCAEPMPKVRRPGREVVPAIVSVGHAPNSKLQTLNSASPSKPWNRLDQAIRATDLLLQAGGFSAIVLDMGSVAPEFALRVPLATWFRYRAAAERTHASVLLLTQHACTKSSAGLVLHCQPSQVDPSSTTVLTGAEHRIEIARERFSKVVDFDSRKPPQSDHSILWNSTTPWSSTQSTSPTKAGRR
jgi:recombination protein RecA